MRKRYGIVNDPGLSAWEKLFAVIINPHLIAIIIAICILMYALK